MKYYLVAGEASGDLHGANLMQAIKQQDPQAEFRFFGGDKMLARGGTLVKHYADMAFMGVVEVLANLRTIRRNMALCKKDMKAWQPDVFVAVDFPGFNLRIAKFAHKNSINVCYYIPPKIWAWNRKRVFKIKKTVDRVLCILPFEKDFYARFGMQVDYVGNPLLDEIAAFPSDAVFTGKNLFHKPVIALLPGSRKQEIERLLPVMLQVMPGFPDHQFVIAGAPAFGAGYYQNFTKDVPVVFEQTYALLKQARAALVTSGTATLETALFKVPQVVLYKGHPLFIWIGRLLIKVKFISLVNLIAGKKIVEELIQDDCTPQRITHELGYVLNEGGSKKMQEDYSSLHELLGEPGASARAAEIIVQTAKKQR